MTSVQKALRSGNVRKDTYERLICQDCSVPLDKRDTGAVGWRRICPDCGRTWKQVR